VFVAVAFHAVVVRRMADAPNRDGFHIRGVLACCEVSGDYELREEFDPKIILSLPEGKGPAVIEHVDLVPTGRRFDLCVTAACFLCALPRSLDPGVGFMVDRWALRQLLEARSPQELITRRRATKWD